MQFPFLLQSILDTAGWQETPWHVLRAFDSLSGPFSIEVFITITIPSELRPRKHAEASRNACQEEGIYNKISFFLISIFFSLCTLYICLTYS